MLKAFAEILYRHIGGELPDRYFEINGVTCASDFRHSLFEFDAFRELVQASEGVPRDLLFIFMKAFFAAHRKEAKKIEKDFVQQEARQWYEQDKYQNLDESLRRALNALIRQLVTRARSTTFLVRAENEKNSVIQQLLDARVVHLLRRGYVDSDLSGDRYSVFTLDYGTYAHLDTSAFVRFGESRSMSKLTISEEMLTRLSVANRYPRPQ